MRHADGAARGSVAKGVEPKGKARADEDRCAVWATDRGAAGSRANRDESVRAQELVEVIASAWTEF